METEETALVCGETEKDGKRECATEYFRLVEGEDCYRIVNGSY